MHVLFGQQALMQMIQCELEHLICVSVWIVVYLEAARERILGFGRAVEVLEPQALRKSIVDFATQIVTFYAG